MSETVTVNEQRKPKEAGAINGGLFPRPKDAPAPTIYAEVASLDQAIRKAEANGGRVVTLKTPIPGMGAYARIADSEGNIIGLFENLSPAG